MKGKRTALVTGLAGITFLFLTAFAAKDQLREEWYLHQLESEENSTVENAVPELKGMKSERAVKRLRANQVWPRLLSLQGIEAEELTHASRLIHLAGISRAEVDDLLGAPSKIVFKEFSPPAYGQPKSLPPLDEQWIFVAPMTHLYIYLFHGKVVLAVEEWSDF
jgi:hypothetical protein